MGVSKINWYAKENKFFSFDQTFPNLINFWKHTDDYLLFLPLNNYLRVIQKGEITSAQCHPNVPIIVLASSKECKLYFCSEKFCSAIELPENLQVISLRWNKLGNKLMIIGEKELCV